jgi:hypothetical protein
MTESSNFTIGFGLLWMGTWFVGIWIWFLYSQAIASALLFTGLFSLFLCMLGVSADEENEKKKK